MDPGDGIALVDDETDTDEIDLAVLPTDGTGEPDISNQIFNPC